MEAKEAIIRSVEKSVENIEKFNGVLEELDTYNDNHLSKSIKRLRRKLHVIKEIIQIRLEIYESSLVDLPLEDVYERLKLIGLEEGEINASDSIEKKIKILCRDTQSKPKIYV